MHFTKTLAASAALLCGTVLSAQAEDITLSFIMCGDVRPADQATIDKFQVDNPGIKVAMEAVPWGTCQDKSMQLAAAGNPVSVAYMGSRTLLKLSSEGLIVPAEISDEAAAAYQPGVLKTVSSGGKYWGYPHAFSTKGL